MQVYRIKAQDGSYYLGGSRWTNKPGKLGKLYKRLSDVSNAITCYREYSNYNRPTNDRMKTAKVISFELVETPTGIQDVSVLLAASVKRAKERELKYKKYSLERSLQTLPKEKDRIEKELEKAKQDLAALNNS